MFETHNDHETITNGWVVRRVERNTYFRRATSPCPFLSRSKRAPKRPCRLVGVFTEPVERGQGAFDADLAEQGGVPGTAWTTGEFGGHEDESVDSETEFWGYDFYDSGDVGWERFGEDGVGERECGCQCGDGDGWWVL